MKYSKILICLFLLPVILIGCTGITGIRNIKFHSNGSNTEIRIRYSGEMRYSVRMIHPGEDWMNNYFVVPYEGELGEYLLEISFYDIAATTQFSKQHPHNTMQSVQVPFGEDQQEMSLKCDFTADHGYKIYLGCDTPFYVEEQETISLKNLNGTISVVMVNE